MTHDEMVLAFEKAMRTGRTVEDIYGVLVDVLQLPRDAVIRARAAYERKVGLISQMKFPRRFFDPDQVKDWYSGPLPGDRFWPALQERLHQTRPEHVVESIDQSSSRVVSLLPNPSRDRFNSRGLVLGYIQSGKTANFSAVIAKAADVSYKFFIVLSGTQNPLRAQTQRRLEQELTDLNPTEWINLTSIDEDFRPQAAGNADAFLTDRTDQRILCVMKKNATVMRRLLRWLKSADERVLRTCPVLIIDDEADVASPNSGPSAEKRTAINRLLLNVLDTIPRVAYVGYTATPFANIFVDPSNPDDIYPRDFIVDLPRPDDYFGPERIFGRERLSQDDVGVEVEGLDMVRTIPETEVPLLRPRGARNRTEFRPELTPSLRDALHYFWMATAARAARGQGDEHSSMLVHTTMYVHVHELFRQLIEAERAAMLYRLSTNDEGLIQQLRTQWSEEVTRVDAGDFGEKTVTFDQLFPHLLRAVERTLIIVENGQSAERLLYEEKGQAQIAIGGNTLARGLTLEGLVVSFFVRSATAYDTLLQMGRWFGYRGGYADLPRIWMTEELEEWFSDLATVEQEIRQDIARYEKENLTPLEFGVRVRRHPQMAITARMKMQSAVECEVSYGGQMVQTILFNHRDQAWLKHNLEAGNRLVRTLVEGEHPIFTRDGRVLFLNVPVSQVQTFLKDYQFHENSTQLRADLLAGYISDQNKYGDLKIWDIGLVGRKPAPGIPTLTFADHIEIPMIERARIPRSEGPANLKAITSQRDRHLLRDLCDDTGLLTGSGNRGLLLLYPIDRNSKPAGPRSSRKPLEAVEHLLGAALVFPESRHPSPQSYFTPDLSGVEREEPEDLDDDADTLEGVE